MATVKEAAEALEAALREVPDLRVYRDPGAVVDPPAVLIGPPILRWNLPGPEPTDAAFSLIVAEPLDGLAHERLWVLVPQVMAAVEDLVDVVGLQAIPGMLASGGHEFPSYELQTEVAL